MFMNRNCDIICFTLSRWDSEISSPALSLAKEFAKTNRVFYIEHPFSWKDYYTYRNTKSVQTRKEALLHGKNIYSNPSSLPINLTVVTPRLTMPVNFLPRGFLYNSLARGNDRTLLAVLRRVIHDYQL